MALFLGLFTPNRLMEQTNSQILHPEHRSGTTANFQDMFFSLLRQFPLIERLCQNPLFVIASDRRKRSNLLGVMLNLVQHLVLSIVYDILNHRS
jgi:hypothetical protein